MDISQIRCLLAVIKSKSYYEAAKKLHLSQSAVSKKIMALEHELDVKLIEKSGKHYTLSDCGKKVLIDFVELGDIYDRIFNTINTYKQNQSVFLNNLRILGVPAMARYDIITLISDFRKNNRDVKISIDEIDSVLVFPLMQRGVYDVAFCEDIEIDSDIFDKQHILRERFMLAVSNVNPLGKKKEITLSDMRNEKIVVLNSRSKLHGLCVDACEKAGFTPIIHASTARPDIALQYVKQNDDLVYLGFKRTLQEIPAVSHKVVDIVDSPEFDFIFIWEKDTKQSSALKDFLQFAAEKFKQ